MYRNKIFFLFCSLFFLNGCGELTALMGPAITMGTNGNIYQAGLSYGTNQAILKSIGKMPLEHVIDLLDPKNEHKGDFPSIANSHIGEAKFKIKNSIIKNSPF